MSIRTRIADLTRTQGNRALVIIYCVYINLTGRRPANAAFNASHRFNGILSARAANVSIKKCFILIYSRLEKLLEIAGERKGADGGEKGRGRRSGVTNNFIMPLINAVHFGGSRY